MAERNQKMLKVLQTENGYVMFHGYDDGFELSTQAGARSKPDRKMSKAKSHELGLE